ncbi:MAG: deoxyribonuclease HsdR [Bacteroides sp. SM23_62_1]|nr:MAG: deoxyribonuclease HsdR [Bacteroides sp. SM23_62_1]
MKARQVLGSVFIAIIGGLIALILYAMLDQKEPAIIVQEKPAVRYVNLPGDADAAPSDFTLAAERAVDAVVHVKTKVLREGTGNPLYDFFFGYRYSDPEPVVGYGSGVIISSDGYIVTNNHVIEGSQAVEVVLNDRRTFDAEIIGTDPTTDLAVLKIKSAGLPFLVYGNSGELRLGEWVLAIGNPYNLTSTVTAGIVSAKARNINILGELAIEAFIQTDAAVNPGNSGGALVNTRGELVGINAAIASRTGAFSGYSFAIPVSIVHKVVDDIIEYGTVQRAILGVTITDVTAENAKEYNISRIEGVLVTGLRQNSAAIEAGIELGDVITAINGVRINTASELQEQVSRYRPNDKITVTIVRKNKERQLNVILRNPEGGTGLIQKEQTISVLGATFGEVTDLEKQKLGIKEGVKVITVSSGKFRNAGIREGFIITQINNKSVKDSDELNDIIKKAEGGIYIEGIYPEGLIAYYAIRL